MDLHDAERENLDLRRDLNAMTVRVRALEQVVINQGRNACRCAATRTVVADRATRRRNRRWTPSPIRVVIRGGAGTQDDPHRLVEFEDVDRAESPVAGGSGSRSEEADESGAEGPAPREESPEL